MRKIIFLLIFSIVSIAGISQFIIDHSVTPIIITMPSNVAITSILDVDGGHIYLGSATTPSLGVHDQHGVIYFKPGGELYYLYDSTGNTEFRVIVSKGWQTFDPTVTLVGGTGNTVPVYTTNTGRYNQRNDVVRVSICLIGDGGDEGAGTGEINIALPVAAGSLISGMGIGVVGIATDNNENYILHGIIAASGTTISFQRWSSIKVLDPFIDNDQDNTDRHINIHFWYEID